MLMWSFSKFPGLPLDTSEDMILHAGLKVVIMLHVTSGWYSDLTSHLGNLETTGSTTSGKIDSPGDSGNC
jgi:hypothetical protein